MTCVISPPVRRKFYCSFRGEKPNKEIANGLNCTERTVKHHMTNIMRKSNVRNRVEAVLKFRQRANVGQISAGSGEYADAREPTIRI
jgi:hypothetical protein